MNRFLLCISLFLFLLAPFKASAQDCEITSISVSPLACNGDFFSVVLNMESSNTSPGFTLAGNGIIYGTYLYSELPVVLGPFLGDDESTYEFVAWDVEFPECQQSVSFAASDCGPICDFSNVTLESFGCTSQNNANVILDFDYQGNSGPVFDVFYENGTLVDSWLYESLPVTKIGMQVNGAGPMIITICDRSNNLCCETFELPAIDCNPNNCEFYNVSIDPECTGANFLVHLDFDFINVASDSFTLTGNNLNYGLFAYSDLPVTLGPLNGGTNINWQFSIRDSELTSCIKTATLGQYTCPPPCDVLSLTVDPLLCNEDDTYSMSLDVDVEGEGDTGFAIFSASTYYGTFDYDDVPVALAAIQGSGSIVDEITVCDIDNEGCCNTILYEALPCQGCLIYNLHAVAQPCDDLDSIYVLLDFDYHNVGLQGFRVSGNGTVYGEFAYEQVPVLIGGFPGNGTQFLEFVVTDIGNEECFDAVEIGLLGCDDICELSELVVDPIECTGDDQYSVIVDFDYENVLGEEFDLFINGEHYDEFDFEDLPITIEELPSSGNVFDTIRVCDNGNPDCCTELVFEALECECRIFEVSYEVLPCITDSTFAIEVDFFYENMPGNFVDISFNGVYLGFYSVLDLPLILEIPEGEGFGVLNISANDLATCFRAIDIPLMNCEAPPCQIYDLFAEAGDCNDDTTLVVDVTFNHANLPGDSSVLIYAGDVLLGQFQLQPDFIRIEDFPAPPSGTATITVCAPGMPDCCDTYVFEADDCVEQCIISELVAEPGPCLTDSTYILVIEYDNEDVPADQVVLTANGNFIGTYTDPDGQIIVEDFPVYDTNITVISICALGAVNCCASYEFETKVCNQPCEINELDVNFEGCMTDSTYLVAVNFNYVNGPSDSVILTANNEYIGTFFANNGHIVVEHIPIFGTNHTVFTLCAVGAPDCCDAYELETPVCDGCSITELDVNFEGCQSDTSYTVAVNFDFNDLPGDSVIIYTNVDTLGTYHVNEGHIVVSGVPVYETNQTVIIVCAADDPECCRAYEFETPACNECDLFDLDVNFEGCQSDSTYLVAVNFGFLNLPTDSVVITANETPIGTFHVSDGHFIIEEFPVFPGETRFTVCAQGAPDCCISVEYESPVCDGSCHIFELFAEAGECTSDSTFLVDVVFNSINLPSDSVTIFANDNNLGNFFNNPDFIRIEDFPLQDGETTLITVCAVGAPDCCDTYVLENPFNTCACDISDIEVDVLECTSDSTFALVANFEYENISAGGFDVYAGLDYLGFFSFENVPIEIPDFPANSTGEYVITICESDNVDCCEFLVFEGPVCDTVCDISNLTYEVVECNETGDTFYIRLDFDFDNVGEGGFFIEGNGNNYGNFSYDDVPVILGPFAESSLVYEFLVRDAQVAGCFEVIVPGIIGCPTGIADINPQEVFRIFSNGTTPRIQALKDIQFTLYTSTGKMVMWEKEMPQGLMLELNALPSGVFIGRITYQGNMWPVKLVKNSH